MIATKASPLEGLLGGGIYIEPAEGEIARALEFVRSSEETRLRMGEEALRRRSGSRGTMPRGSWGR